MRAVCRLSTSQVPSPTVAADEPWRCGDVRRRRSIPPLCLLILICNPFILGPSANCDAGHTRFPWPYSTPPPPSATPGLRRLPLCPLRNNHTWFGQEAASSPSSESFPYVKARKAHIKMRPIIRTACRQPFVFAHGRTPWFRHSSHPSPSRPSRCTCMAVSDGVSWPRTRPLLVPGSMRLRALAPSLPAHAAVASFRMHDR
ncbi:hypothetical protein L226DRAFT_69098 [Lentinus tigrinus ALCF2SS1-7]|uniref:uncharacterized protein n=1 Tax=Lentinus tigrinus ALCF2SS1-7 TaxID=1328758 RepID=UPI001165FA06|nr:hypothetical protein L226DRAFT_69098 [Lentinus tigrinus ALCF2SS1-7]